MFTVRRRYYVKNENITVTKCSRLIKVQAVTATDLSNHYKKR